MFKFKGISSEDMQVIIEEEEHFIARAAQKYEITEVEGKDGAIFDELGYSYVERPIYVQCLNINKIDDILAWLNGEGEFEYKGRKTIARFYSQLEPIRQACIRIIDTTFIRNPFWYKADDEFEIVKAANTYKEVEGSNIQITDADAQEARLDIVSGKSEQDTTVFNGQYCPPVEDWTLANGAYIDNEGHIVLPNANSKASVDIFWNKASNEFFIKADIFSEINTYIRLQTDYLDANKSLLAEYNSNGASANTDASQYALKTKVGIGEYKTSIANATYIKIIFFRQANNENDKEYKFKNVTVGKTDYIEDYVEFVPDKPSSNFTSEIENAGGDNLCNTDILKSKSKDYSVFTNIEQNSFTLDLSKGNLEYLTSQDILFGELDKNEQYTLSYHLKQNNSTFMPVLAFVYEDGTKTFSQSNRNDVEIETTSKAGQKIVRISLDWSNASDKTSLVQFTNISLNKGTKKKEYAPFNSCG